MNIDYKQAKAVFLEAVHNVPSDDWDAYLNRVCAGDAELREHVHDLLKEHAQARHLATHAVQAVAARVVPAVAEGPGASIGPYKLLEQIGEGGMGLVFMAEQQRPVRRLVALKLVKPGMDSKQVIARFEAERQALAMMDHPHIAKVLDAGTVGEEVRNAEHGMRNDDARLAATPHSALRAPHSPGRPYFVMELVRGIPINEFCDHKRLPVRQRLELFIQVCQAVQHAHQKGIIHRDLKPTNVLVTMHDTVAVPKVIDFGIAKALGAQLTEHTLHTGFAQLIGTPLYMSPEQAEMNQFGVDTRSDVYSLGVMLYELLTGTTPFDKETLKDAGFDEMRRIIREEEPETVSMRLARTRNSEHGARNSESTPRSALRAPRWNELDWIVMRSLEKDRNRRYESASAFAADVQRYLNDEPVQACPPTAAYRFRKFHRQHRTALSTAALVAAALVLGTVVSVWQAVRATTAERTAQHYRQNAERSASTALETSRLATQREREARAAAAAETTAKLAEAEQRQRAEASEATARQAEADAKQAAAEARAVLSFFQDRVLAAAAPVGRAAGLGKDVTLRKVVDLAEPTIAAAFKDQPVAEAEVRHVLGKSYSSLSEFDLAIPQLLRAHELSKEGSWALQNQIVGTLRLTYIRMGRFAESITLCQRNLESCKAALGPDDRQTITAIVHLAKAYDDSEQSNGAVPLLEDALRVASAKFGEKDELTLSVMEVLVWAYPASQAIPLAEKTLALRKEVLGPDHRDTLTSMRGVARAYVNSGRREEGLARYEETARLANSTLGPSDSDTLYSMCACAAAYYYSKLPDKAIPIWEEVYNREVAAVGVEHQATFVNMNNLGAAYNQIGRYDDAIRWLEKSVALHRAKLPNSPRTLMPMAGLIAAYSNVGRPNDAVKVGEEALALATETSNLSLGHALDCANNLALVYNGLDRFDDAVRVCEQMLHECREKFGPDDEQTLRFLSLLHHTHNNANKWPQAEHVAREQLEILRRKEGPEGSRTLNALYNLADNLIDQRRFDEAERLLRECVAASQKKEPDSWQTFLRKSILGWCLMGQARELKSADAGAAQQKFTEAEPLIVGGYEGIKARESQIDSSYRWHVNNALGRVIGFYTEVNNADQRAKWQQIRDAQAPKAAAQKASDSAEQPK